MGSRRKNTRHGTTVLLYSLTIMDAIKKKMQSMKVEKDNAMDREDVCEQAAKDAKVRASKAEEEVADLVKKAQQLEVELDKTQEQLVTTTEEFKPWREMWRHVRISFFWPLRNLIKLLLLQM